MGISQTRYPCIFVQRSIIVKHFTGLFLHRAGLTCYNNKHINGTRFYRIIRSVRRVNQKAHLNFKTNQSENFNLVKTELISIK